MHKYIDGVVENFIAIKKLAEEIPSFDILSFETRTTNEDRDQDKSSGVSSLSGKRKEAEEKSKDYWLTKEEAGYVSSFLKSNKNVISLMDRQRKEIVDYCFVDDKTISLQ